MAEGNAMSFPLNFLNIRQFSLRAMLLAVTCFAVIVGAIANRAHKQRSARELIQNLGGTVAYDYQLDQDGQIITVPPEPAVPRWLRSTIGDDFFFRITYVDLN